MAGIKHTAEQIIGKLREAEVLLAKGSAAGQTQVCAHRRAYDGR